MLNRISRIVFTAFIVISILPAVSGDFKVEAASNYSFACSSSEFEVSYIEDDGSLTKVSCHSTFEDAKNAMKANSDYVVRKSNSYSKSKIVAMNAGLAYSYPNRRGTNTMYLYQDPKQTGSSLYKQTYISKGYEMTYVDTYSVNANGAGYVQIVMNGFEGFADLEYVDLVPFKYINNSIAIYLGGDHGSTVSYGNEDPYLVKLEQNYYQIETRGNYTDLIFYYHYAYGVNGNKCVTYTNSVDNAKHYLEAGMQKGVKYYSNDGTNFYSDQKLTNKVATVYNYYQFLPFRTATDISADTFNSFVSGYSDSVLRGEGQSFIDAQNAYGINALLVYAMACHESAYGESGYAVHRYNLFGWSAVDSNPNGASYFNSVKDCINAQMGRYINWFIDFTNWRYFGYCIGNKGAGLNVQYASDPYWGVGIASLAYSIDKKSKNNNGELSDYDKYTLAYVKANYNDTLYGSNVAWDANFYGSSTGSSILFTGRYGSHYQKDLIVPILAEANGRYKIQTPNPIENGALVTRDGILPYDWNVSVAYIDKADAKILYGKGQESTEPADTYDELEHEAFSSVSEMSLSDDGIISLGGIAYISKCNFSESKDISHIVEIYDLKTNEKVTEFNCENTDTSWYQINDGFDYKWAGFRGSFDLKTLEKGTYIFKVSTKYKDKDALVSVLKTSIDSLSLFDEVIEDVDYRISTNDVYGYRIELDITSKIFDFSAIRRPSNRSSLVTIDAVEYEENEDTVYAQFSGLGMMFYLDYDNEDVSHELYFVGEDDKVIKADTATEACTFDYQTLYNSSYDMSHICYKARVDLAQLTGAYRMYLKITNGNYEDIVEMLNMYETVYSGLDNDRYTTSFGTDPARYAIIFDVFEKQ